MESGTPNHEYSPNIFVLEPGSWGGLYRIYTCGIIPQCDKALTVEKETNSLKFSNDTSLNYDWCFTCKNGVYAIQWCGTPDIKDTRFVLYRYEDELHGDQLLLTPSAPATPLPEQYLHKFYSP